MLTTPHQILKKYFGYDNFRQGQEEAISRIINKQPTLLVMPTGSGKSIVYQVPAMLLPGVTLVISPLIALMKDQVDSLTEAGIPAAYINSSLPASKVNRITKALLEGHIKLLYIAPERLRSNNFTRALAKIKISLLAIDEAHCISQWGHDFRPDYLQIAPVWQALGRPTLLATTATATANVRSNIINLLGLDDVNAIVTGFNRPNLTFRVKNIPNDSVKYQLLQAMLAKVDGSVIVYAATRRSTEEVADFIRHNTNLTAQHYHAGLDRDIRHKVQNQFMSDRLKVVVATNAFGMGIDKPDVRIVVHYNMPSTVEAYYQEAGRAGRDGLPAECVMLFSPDDRRLQKWLIEKDAPTYDDLHQVYSIFSRSANNGELFLDNDELAESTGLHRVKIRVILSQLELAGAVFHLGRQGNYSNWKVLPLADNALRERDKAIRQRTTIRMNLLKHIINYACLTSCRRLFLLNYFGDVSPPESPQCCDNHNAEIITELPKAITPREWYPLIVLETTRSLRPVGRKRLSQLLHGSKAKNMHKYGYDNHKFYGKLSFLEQRKIITLIDALIEDRYLQMSSDKYPVLSITSLGIKALDARVALPIAIPEPPAPAAKSSGTILQTLELFKQGLTPTQIAEEREMVEGTIYTHLSKLIVKGQVELNEVVPPDIEILVLEAIKEVGNITNLFPLKEILPDTISYGDIRCILSAHPELPRTDNFSIVETELIEQDKNSPPPSSETTPNEIIIEAVGKLGGMVGRTGLAKFLTGSGEAWLERLRKHSYYGQLSDMSQKSVVNIVDALISDGRLLSTGGNRPKVVLPDQKIKTNSEYIEEQQAVKNIAVPSVPVQETAHLPQENKPTTSIEAIMAVLSDLDGLLTVDGLAQLLTAAPGEVVPFSDHELFGLFHSRVSFDEMLIKIQNNIKDGHIALSRPYQRVILP